MMTESSLGRVLVVDDDPRIGRLCSRVLQHEGWSVVVADDGQSALSQLETAPFDCVVSDIHMPDLDGYQLLRALRQRDDAIPVLLMTGDPSLDGAVRAMDTGAVTYLSKPFHHQALATAVARAARQHGVARARKRADSMARALLGPADAPTRTVDLEQRFANALRTSWMAFQPIVDVAHRRVFAYEALLRNEEESLRRPDLMIAAAERLDRVHELGRTVRAAVARAAITAPPGVLLFVNVHGLELTDEELFAGDGALVEHASRVVLEITERTSLDPINGPARVAMLRKLGYRIAVDDLGAGYAALGALASLEPEIVKLDMSLVRDLDRNPTKRRVVAAIATLCRELGGRVVGEGVETDAERVACVDSGIDLIQGYLFARPARGFQPVAFP